MGLRTFIVRQDSPVVLSTRSSRPHARLIIHAHAAERTLMCEDVLGIVAAWQCTDRAGAPSLHTHKFYAYRPKDAAHFVEPGDEFRITTWRDFDQRHITVTERDGRLIVVGESTFYTMYDENQFYE